MIKHILKTIKVLFDKKELGMKDSDFMNFFILVIGVLVSLSLLGGLYYWGVDKFVYIWLLGLTGWALLHIRKSMNTWSMFEEVDQRSSDYAEEVDLRFDNLELKIQALVKQKSTPTVEVKKKTKKKASKKKTNKND